MEKKFPRYLHTPLQVLWFESDELFMLFLFLLFAIMFESWIFWALLIAAPYAYGKAKKKYPRGFLKHTLYFMGMLKMEYYPLSFEKKFLE